VVHTSSDTDALPPRFKAGEDLLNSKEMSITNTTTTSGGRKLLQGAGGGGGGGNSPSPPTCTTSCYDCNCYCASYGTEEAYFSCGICYTAYVSVSYARDENDILEGQGRLNLES